MDQMLRKPHKPSFEEAVLLPGIQYDTRCESRNLSAMSSVLTHCVLQDVRLHLTMTMPSCIPWHRGRPVWYSGLRVKGNQHDDAKTYLCNCRAFHLL